MDTHEGFNLPELIIESVIRDGLLNIKNNPAIIDSVFAQLNRVYNSQKYSGEIAKIKAMVQKDVAVVFSYGEVDAHPFSYSIMIGEDTEDKKRAHLSDFYGQKDEIITDETELQALIKLENVVITAYDPISGKVTLDPGTDLTNIYRYMILVDAADQEHQLIEAVSDQPGEKLLFIAPNSDLDFSDFSYIKSSLGTDTSTTNGVTGDQKLVIGVHSRDALTTKYLYILLKYFILSRKQDVIKRGLYVSTYSGSDFNRDADYVGSKIYTRFLTIMGKVDDTWKQELVEIIDNIIIDPKAIE